MSLSLFGAAIVEKNKVQSDGAWLVLLEIFFAGQPDALRIVRNNDIIPWNGHNWTPFPFEMEDVTEDTAGEVPNVVIKVSNVTQEIQGFIEDTGGGVDCTINLYVIHSKHLDVTTPVVSEVFTITDVKCDPTWVTFNLGPDYPVFARRPERRFLADYCQYKEYGGVECGVDLAVKANYPTCRRTLADCRLRQNSVRFGGEPAIASGGIYV